MSTGSNFQTKKGFTSNLGAIMAAAGGSIGLGNIWRFPYTVGENGGGAFIIVYLIFVVLLGVPLVMSELMLGRRSGKNAVGTFRDLAPKHRSWQLVGLLGVIVAFMIYSFYGVVFGWTLNFTGEAFTGTILNQDESQIFSFFAHPYYPLIGLALALALTAGVVVAGVQKGIEKCTKILMPILFVIILLLCIRSITLPNASKGLAFLFKPDFSKLTSKAILNALGQSMFSLSIGMCALITYGSYMRKEDNLFASSLWIAGADTAIAIFAGIAIFPAVFSFGFSPAEGPSLVYVVLPNVFNEMPFGQLFAILFFLLLSIAALTSTILLLEILVLWAVEEFKMKRWVATLAVSVIIFIIGSLCSLSFGPLKEYTIFGDTLFNFLDKLTATYLMPFGALCIALFIGWYYPKNEIIDEFSNKGTLKTGYLKIFYSLMRYVVPIALLIVLLSGIFGL
ncbi:MAG: sodium-dependent transporter [Bacteroidales bacterium]|nr:sodium-dependent transporter [Bacteroidales bacterium]